MTAPAAPFAPPFALLVGLAAVAAAVALALTARVRRYALDRAVLDVPNERSSHTVPTPRGGGLAVVAVTLVGAAGLAAAGIVPTRVSTALVGGGALVAAVGWRDDRRGVAARVRFAAHAAAGVWAVAWLGGLPALSLGGPPVPLGAAGVALAVVATVWCVNLYNFMDGIDGIAGVEAVTTAGAFGAMLAAAGRHGLAAVAVLIAGAAAGFLYWNRPPARIFLGDVGSGFLGFAFAVLAIAAERAGPSAAGRAVVPGVALMTLLLAAFVVDATLTLVRRMLRGERWTEAHRSHAYQRAVQSGLSHAQVTGAVLGLNLVLAALAAFAAAAPARLAWALPAGLGLAAAFYLAAERRRPMAAPVSAPPGARRADPSGVASGVASGVERRPEARA